MLDVIDLTKKLIACPSVTPEEAGAQLLLAEHLESAGFTCTHLPFQDVPNLFARIGEQTSNGPHLCYAGHTDVVPPGPEEAWTYGPFNPTIKDGILYGRGASDMKGSVAAFTCAAINYIQKNGPPNGSISLLITGDEEGDAINGTVKVLEWMKDHGHIPDVTLVGEPTNPETLGEAIKIGRRGSLTGTLAVEGKQGHSAYPERANNPLPHLIKLLNILEAYEFDQGSDHFVASNLEITTIDVGNPAPNVIPKTGKATFNIRFNDHWTGESLSEKITELLNETGYDYQLDFFVGAESFITEPGDWSSVVAEAVEDMTGRKPEFTTTGGTSDARFVHQYCPVVEFGPINETIHQIDENANVQDLEDLTKIYERILETYFEK